MARIRTRGRCYYCREIFSRPDMIKHLGVCKEREEALSLKDKKKRRVKSFHIFIDAYDIYWLHIKAPVSIKLKDLDKFLRDIWVECCDHVSTFRIGGQTYSSYPDETFNEKSMLSKLFKILSPGDEFIYEYDVSSPTKINLKILEEFKAEDDDITVMARNEPLEFICSGCVREAVVVCTYCVWDGSGYLCPDCANAHRCGPELLLPIINSPRMGICRYGAE